MTRCAELVTEVRFVAFISDKNVEAFHYISVRVLMVTRGQTGTPQLISIER